jgi:phage shock protein PspC (stress-responsive transcriptional regulator)
MNETSTTTASDSQPDTPPTTESKAPPTWAPYIPQALRRPRAGRMIGGVAGGIADYLGTDVTVVRIALTVLAIMGGAGLPVYLAGWVLIPEEGRDISIAGEFLASHQAQSS